MIGEGALEAALLALGGAEVDHPRVDPVLMQERDRARGRRDVVDLGGQHHRRDEQHRGARAALAVAVGVAVVPAQLVDAVLGDDLVGRRLLVVSRPPNRATSKAF